MQGENWLLAFCRQGDSFEIFSKLNFPVLGLANLCFNCTLEAALNAPGERSKIPDYIRLYEKTWPGIASKTPALAQDHFKCESETSCLATSLQSPANISHLPGDSSHKQHLLINQLEERSFIFICWFNSSECILSQAALVYISFTFYWGKQFVLFLKLIFILLLLFLSFILYKMEVLKYNQF